MSTMPARTWLALALVVALAHGAILVGGDTFADLGWLGQVGPARHAAGDAIAHGTLPAWWDEAGFGVALLAEPRHGALYPPTWLAAAGGRALDAIALLHVWWLAAGVAALARRLGADDAAALVAGACAALAGVVTGAVLAGDGFALAWTPWCAVAAAAIGDAARRPSRIRAALGLALTTAACALAGSPVVLAATVVLAPVVAGARGRGAAAGWAAAASGAGLLLAGIQLAPALLHAVAGHAAGPDVPGAGARLLELIAPGATPTPPHHLASLAGGATVVALAVLARSRWLAVPAAAALAGLLWAPLAAIAWSWLAALAGVGLSRLVAAPPDRRTLVVAAAALGGLTLARALAAAARYPLAAALDARGLDGAVVVERGLTRGGVALGLALVAVAALIVAARRSDPRLAAAAGLVVLAEVAIGGRTTVPRLPRLDGPPPLVAPLSASEEAPRVQRNVAGPPRARSDRRDRADDVEAGRDRAAAASAAPWGVAAVPGTDPARLALEDRLPAATAAVAARVIDRLAVTAAIVPRSITIAAGTPVLAEQGDEALIATSARRTRGFWAARWRYLDDAAALAALAPPPGQPAEPLGSVILAGAGDAGGDPSAPPRPCALRRTGPAEVTMRCEVSAAGYAVVLDAWAPGWSATVDGRPATVERADLIARAVRVDAGARTIVWRYTPPGWWLGVAISALAALNLGLVAWLVRARSGTGTGTGTGTG